MAESKREKRTRIKKVVISGMSVTVNGKIYGTASMVTAYDTSLSLPNKEKVQEVCAESYMKLLRIFTENDTSAKTAKQAFPKEIFGDQIEDIKELTE